MGARDTSNHSLRVTDQNREPDAPEPRSASQSGLATLALDHLLRGKLDDTARRAVLDNLGPALESQMETIRHAVVDAVTSTTQSARPNVAPIQRSLLPWFVTLFSLFLMSAGSLSIIWWRLIELEKETKSGALYDRELAHWLVISGHDDFRAAEALDQMMRRVAKGVGVSVDDINSPVYTDPPNSVQRRHLEFTE